MWLRLVTGSEPSGKSANPRLLVLRRLDGESHESVLEGLRSRPDAKRADLCRLKALGLSISSKAATHNSHSGNFKNGYLRVGNWKFKGGAGDPDGKIMKATMVTLLEKLLADGALHSYSIDEETSIRVTRTGSRSPLLPTALKASTSSKRQSRKMKKETRRMGRIGSLLDNEGHRDFLARVDSMANK